MNDILHTDSRREIPGQRKASFQRILVMGATGMLGKALMVEGRGRGYEMRGASRGGSDLAVEATDAEGLSALMQQERPDVVINAAAVTDLALCERDPGTAYAVNSRLVALLAELSRRFDAWLVQVSTDHYFTGDGQSLHDEASLVRLLNEYARTKFCGECFALTAPGSVVLRTNIVGFRGKGGGTFVEWVLENLQAGCEIRAFTDYIVSSISCRQFAAALFDLLPAQPAGVLNLASSEVFSKLQFIEGLKNSLKFEEVSIVPTSVHTLGGPRRAESLGLDVRRAEEILGRPLPRLSEVCADLAKEYRGEAYAL